ncbi:conserved oligomeric Golgi complex subunit 1-like [Physella acuta]|uniref:conserved oligomeric Golgi complex subunit 1-like n=1 Tax=Physella acuta TaxID=109671 RepID=UPI0027DD8466|nr:conserved oligomeric Golgi complex subunit 1-like [Physella acuta]
MAAHRPSVPQQVANNVQRADSNALFEKHTIEEIRNLEKKTRSDIEKKKEDLRVMVGERYRDLIDAADTITDMKTSAQNVMKSIAKMEHLCSAMRQKHMVRGSSFPMAIKNDSDKNGKEMEFYGKAAQIKLLMDIPEKIWSSVDSQEYLTAARLYLLARHINASLHLDSQLSADVVTWFPVLTRQWAAISHFKTTILQGCRLMLADTEADLSDQQMADVLCCIILLEDTTPRQVFTEFLLARTKALQQILHSGHQVNVKVQILSVARLLTSTLRQIYSVFYQHESQHPGQTEGEHKGLLLETLENVLNKPGHGNLNLELHGTISSKCLPPSVKNFQPLLRRPAAPLQIKQLKENCQQWMNTCLQDVQSGVGKLLNYVNTVKRLADIRDELWALLTAVQSEPSWLQMNENILTLRVWEDFLRPLFLERVKALVQYQLDTTAELTRRTVSKAMMELTSDVNDSSMQCERNLAVFVWTESSSDILMSDIWQTAATKTISDSGGLILKARAFTPAVQSLCQSVDEKLKILLEDTESFVLEGEEKQEEGAFNRFADTSDILKYMQGSCVKCVQEILDYLTEQLRLWEKSLADIPDPVTNAITENKLLLTARTCAAMIEMTPHLQSCILALPNWNKQAPFKLAKKLRTQKFELPEWMSVHAKLRQCQMLAYKIWVEYTANSLVTQFSDTMARSDPDSILAASTRWDEVEIAEESEEGKKLASKIFVPMQASWHIQTLLYTLCKELNKIGIQALPRTVVRDLLVMVTDGIVTTYERAINNRGGKKSSNPFSQHEVLQELFNFKFVQLIIPRREDDELHKNYQQRCQTVIDRLEEQVDPFDLDVFSPYIQANLIKQAQRCSVIFGTLYCMDKHGQSSLGSRPILTGQEQHNVLPLSSCPQRFPLLPLSSQQSNTRSALTTQPITSQTISRNPEASGPTLTSVVEATLPSTSSQADLSSSFYDKMEKLGSMGSRIFSNISGKS